MLLALEDIRQRMDNPQLPVTDGLMAAVCGMSFHNVKYHCPCTIFSLAHATIDYYWQL